MTGRPEVLFPLFAALTSLAGIGPRIANNMRQMAIIKTRDLLFTLPHAGINRQRRSSVKRAALPEIVTVDVEIGAHIAPRTKTGAYRINVTDSETDFQLVYFHAKADYLKRLLPSGSRRVVSGKVDMFDNIVQMVHPDYTVEEQNADKIPHFEPIYPLTAGVTQKTMAKASATLLTQLPNLPEWIDQSHKKQQRWPDWSTALRQVHTPKSPEDIAASSPAKQRLAYDEFMAHQLTLAIARANLRRVKGRQTHSEGKLKRQVLNQLPYTPTSAQTRAVAEIAGDMASTQKMNRLLQGDVGSGKTLVAFLALLIAVEASGQGVMMAPTEILARQHYEVLKPLAKSAEITLQLLTGRDKGHERQAKLAALQKGQIQMLVGTHAVFQKDVEFRDLRIAIVDEQHRFGVRQRLELGQKGQAVDVLVMTATPIPRSLALAQYGDMDISILDEKPPGRKPITTVLISTGRLQEVVEKLQYAIAEGRQIYWVCPLVEESELSDLTAAEARFNSLRAQLGEAAVGLIHGQMPAVEKDQAMHRFQSGETSLLVATTVIEVGVNIHNATIMVIERAESFGLAQLHQLRGRVGRGDQQSTCLLLYQAPLSQSGRRRLTVLRETEDGFKIAEADLKMRGAGDLIGTAQSGLPRFRVADIESQADLMAVAQSDARKLLENDPKLTSPRGTAAKTLLYLTEQEQAVGLISVG